MHYDVACTPGCVENGKMLKVNVWHLIQLWNGSLTNTVCYDNGFGDIKPLHVKHTAFIENLMKPEVCLIAALLVFFINPKQCLLGRLVSWPTWLCFSFYGLEILKKFGVAWVMWLWPKLIAEPLHFIFFKAVDFALVRTFDCGEFWVCKQPTHEPSPEHIRKVCKVRFCPCFGLVFINCSEGLLKYY